MHWHAQTCRKVLRTLQNQSQLNFERRIWSAWLMDKLHWACKRTGAGHTGWHLRKLQCVCVKSVWGVCGECVVGVRSMCVVAISLSAANTAHYVVSFAVTEHAAHNRLTGLASPRPIAPFLSHDWLTPSVFVCVQPHIRRSCVNTLDCPDCHTPAEQLSRTFSGCAHRTCQIMHVFIVMCTLFMHSIIIIILPIKTVAGSVSLAVVKLDIPDQSCI